VLLGNALAGIGPVRDTVAGAVGVGVSGGGVGRDGLPIGAQQREAERLFQALLERAFRGQL
jgi:hypothetical protein